MKNIFERLLVFLIGLPLILAVVFFFPQKNHLALNLLVTIFCALGAVEFAAMLKKKGMNLYFAEAIIFGCLPPFAMTLYASFDWMAFTVPAAVLICTSYCLISCAFTPAAKLENAVSRVAAGFSVIIYPGILLSCIILMATHPFSSTLIISFLCIVLVNDAAAWLFGMLFGRNNAGIVAASPNKSIVGFIAGFAASMAAGVGASMLQPEAFTAARFTAQTSGIILGLTTGLAATIGDLAESALKRSSGVKDSGSIIPGRGGILDTVDSIALAAPVFFIVYNVLFIIQ